MFRDKHYAKPRAVTVNYDDLGNFPFAISGYGSDTVAASPFTPENIVIVTDGFCLSSCTTFTGLATRYGGARTITYGGRPIKEPMQAMGGVKGGGSLGWSALNSRAQLVWNATKGNIPDAYKSTFINHTEPPLLPSISGSDYSLNFRNAHNNFSDPTPLQFVYEAANCKQFSPSR